MFSGRLSDGLTMAHKLHQYRQHRHADNTKNHDLEVVFNNRNLPEKITRQREQTYPGNAAAQAITDKTPVGHIAHSGYKWREGAHE